MDEGRTARQPTRVVWSMDRLVHERAIALGNALDKSTQLTYSSHLNSYLSFVKTHNLPVDPTPDTLSFYTVYMCHHINPRSVNTYLSGIVSALEPHFPGVREARKSRIVSKTLQGCMRLRGTATIRRRALTIDDLRTVSFHYASSKVHDDVLFVAMLFTGFFGLLRLGELTFPEERKLRNWKKITKRETVKVSPNSFEFLLPGHKADRFFEGNKILIPATRYNLQPLQLFMVYLNSRDKLFPFASALWLTSEGLVPTRNFFMNRIRLFFGKETAGQSMRAGGATALAEHGASPSVIQASGRWVSEAFLVYIRKHPALLQGLLHANAQDVANEHI